MKKPLLLIGLAAAVWTGGVRAAEENDVLKMLVPGHPRLLMKANDLAALKKHHEKDPVLQRIVGQVLVEADKQIGKPALEHKLPDGKRLLSVSRECLNRTLALGFAYRWTGDMKYVRAGAANLLTVCAFKDWNPAHFLDTAEMACAVGLGYDWFFEALTLTERETIRTGLIRHGLEVHPGWGVSASHNWNQVCNGGLIVGSLAVAETNPAYARTVVSRAIKNLPLANKHYAPDGAWMEGPGYWEYATTYLTFALAALESSLGTSFGLAEAPGLDRSGYFPVYMAGPSGNPLCFADAHMPKPGRSGVQPPVPRYNYPCLFWLARRYRNNEFSDALHEVLARDAAKPLAAVWYVPPTGRSVQRALDRFFDGLVPILVMRSAWNDPGALWCGVKAGLNPVNHGHLDLGNFELESGGVRFALDLGSDNYNMPGYFGRERYQYYRLKSESHNVPLLAGKGQLADGVAKVLEVKTGGESPFITVDLTHAYRDRADKVERTVAMVDRRRAVEVRDVFELKAAGEILWGMTTAAEIAIEADGSALLTQGGAKLRVRVRAPATGVFSVESAEQKPPENENQGIRRLVLKVSASQGPATVHIRLEPERT